MIYVVINGGPCAGKDTFCSLCAHYTNVINVSTVDFVKKAAQFCGWNGEKNAKSRKFLSDLKDLLTSWEDVPYRKTIAAIEEEYERLSSKGVDDDEIIAFIHCREPHEIARFKRDLGAKTVLMRRPALNETPTSNHADAEVENYCYDYIIINDGTLEDLKHKAANFLESVQEEKNEGIY